MATSERQPSRPDRMAQNLVGDPSARLGPRLQDQTAYEPRMLMSLADRFDPAHTALVIVDMQYDFCVEGFAAHAAGRDVGPARAIIPNIQRLLHACRASKMPVAHVGFITLANHQSDSGPWLAQRRRSTKSSEKLGMEGSKGAEFVPELKPIEGEWQVPKHRYSAFTGTNLDVLLRSRGVRSVVITGVSTNACIDSTMRAAFEHEYYVAVPTDGVASWNHDLHKATLENCNHRIGVTPTTDELVAIWQAKAKVQ